MGAGGERTFEHSFWERSEFFVLVVKLFVVRHTGHTGHTGGALRRRIVS
jgi:hypothetical protein